VDAPDFGGVMVEVVCARMEQQPMTCECRNEEMEKWERAIAERYCDATALLDFKSTQP